MTITWAINGNYMFDTNDHELNRNYMFSFISFNRFEVTPR